MQHVHIAFTGEKYKDHFNHWNGQWTAALAQPYVFRGNAKQASQPQGLEKRISFPEQQKKLIRRYAANRDMESFILLLSGIFILLQRYQEREFIVIDTPLKRTDGALAEQWEDRVPIACQPHHLLHIRQVLEEVNNAVVKGYNYQNFPFQVLPQGRNQEKNVTSNVLIYSRGLHVMPTDRQLAAYDLIVEIIPNDDITGEMSCVFNASGHLFSDWFLENLCAHYLQVMSAFADMEKVLQTVNIFPEEEFTKIINGFNDTGFTFPRDKTVVALFAGQVAATPDHPAVIYRDKKLTYRQLDEQSNKLARALVHDYGVCAGATVGVMMDKSEDAVISILAVMKAGAVYVPIDPGNPRDRIAHILQDAAIKVMITHSAYMFDFGDFQGKLLALDIQLGSMPPSIDPLEIIARPSDLAYIIYTSGSTGLPKGVLIEHAGLTNVSLQHVQELEMSSDDVYLQFMSLAFDGAILDIFTALLSGAALLMPDKAIISNTEIFLEYITRHQASVLTLTPSYLAALNRHPMPAVRILISAGEAARVDDARFYAAFKQFYNAYGPSEVTVNASLYKMKEVSGTDIIPIGKPGANKYIYMLNDQQQLVPTGLAGEICIAGEGLARGYLNDEVLTGKKFIKDPFREGQRMYLSGDIGRWLPDGNMEYLGRKDEQVKLNGFRVDLGEVEAALRRNPHVKQTAVLLHQKEEGKNELLAFFEPREKLAIVPSLGEYFIYDPFLYSSMANDKMRVEGYKMALKELVKGKVVLDPGTGREMILARHCLDAGAQKVYAVEIDEVAYQEAKENLIHFNLQERIILLKGDVTKIPLPEDVDYVVSALAGNIASADGCIPIMKSIRQNLSREVKFIPHRYTTQIAAVSLPDGVYDEGFNEVSAHYITKVFEKYQYKFDLRLCLRHFSKEYLISDSTVCEDIHYAGELLTEEALPLVLTVNAAKTLHGLVLWVNAFSDKGIMIDSMQKTHHLPVYFPLSERGIAVVPGDKISFTFERKLSDNMLNPDYFINGFITGKDKEIRISYSSYNHRRDYKQRGFYDKMFDETGSPRVIPDMAENTLKAFLREQLPAYMVPSRFIKVPEFPVTRNGKRDNDALLQMSHLPSAEDVIKDLPRNEMEERLIGIMKNVLGMEQIGIFDDFFKIGGDSIKAIQIASRMHQEGFKMEVKHLFATPVMADLAAAVVPLSHVADQAPVSGVIPFSPIQHELFPPGVKDPHHYNQAVMFFSEDKLDGKAITEIFSKIYEHHDLLRATFDLEAASDQQFNSAVQPFYITEMDLPGNKEGQTLLETMANGLQTSIDLKEGPLMKVGLFHMPDGDRLLLIIHHLVVDTVSWRILFEDINSLLLQYHKGSSYQLPLKTSSFKEWITQQYKYADSPEFLKEKEYWRQLESTAVPPFQREWEGDGRAIFDAEEVVLSTESTAALLRMVNVAFEADMNDLLLTAIGMALKSITGNNKILLALEGHGREDISSDIDVSRTVGWFTSMYPVVLDIENEQEPLVQLQAIKTSLRKIPKKGIGHGILKYLTSKEKKADLQFLLQPRIGFNYLGQFDTDINNLSLRIAAEPVGKLKSDQHNGKHDLEIKALLTGNKLHLSASYCVNHFREETITRMLDHCVHSLENIIAAANSYNGVSPLSGFAYKELSVQDLESLFD